MLYCTELGRTRTQPPRATGLSPQVLLTCVSKMEKPRTHCSPAGPLNASPGHRPAPGHHRWAVSLSAVLELGEQSGARSLEGAASPAPAGAVPFPRQVAQGTPGPERPRLQATLLRPWLWLLLGFNRTESDAAAAVLSCGLWGWLGRRCVGLSLCPGRKGHHRARHSSRARAFPHPRPAQGPSVRVLRPRPVTAWGAARPEQRLPPRWPGCRGCEVGSADLCSGGPPTPPKAPVDTSLNVAGSHGIVKLWIGPAAWERSPSPTATAPACLYLRPFHCI